MYYSSIVSNVLRTVFYLMYYSSIVSNVLLIIFYLMYYVDAMSSGLRENKLTFFQPKRLLSSMPLRSAQRLLIYPQRRSVKQYF